MGAVSTSPPEADSTPVEDAAWDGGPLPPSNFEMVACGINSAKDNCKVARIPVVMGNTRVEAVFPNRYSRAAEVELPSAGGISVWLELNRVNSFR
jgi:hypothetical protein